MKDKIFILLLTLALPVSLAATESNYLIDYHSGHYYEAGKTLRKLAHKNDTQALYYLGKMYVKGYGVVHNMKHGNRLILKSAQLGYEPAQNYLAKYFLHKRDTANALFWYKKAASQGNVDAQLFVGSAYLHGFGITKNISEAKVWLNKAAKNKNALAQYYLASLFIKSKDARNRKKAVEWFILAAKNGNKEAQYRLGMSYYFGEGIKQDRAKAVQWLEKSAHLLDWQLF